MRRVVDLTHPITDGMPVFPGDPAVSFRHTREGGYGITELCLGTHVGTHIDAPSHCIAGAHTLDQIPLDALVGWAEVLDLSGKGAGSEITAADLDVFVNRVGEGARVLLRTGWAKHFGEPEFFSGFPGLTEGAALWLTYRKVALLGIEQPSVHPKRHLEVHRALLSSGMALIESVANLDQLTQDRVYLMALPMSLIGLDGAPTRVIAIEGEL